MVVADLRKLVRRPATWVLLGLWPAVQLVFSLLIPYISYLRGSAFQGTSPHQLLAGALPQGLLLSSLAGLPMFGGALVLALGALVAGSEYGWGTLKSLLTQGPRRLTVLTSQLLALYTVLLGTVIATFAVTALGSWVIATVESAPSDWPGPGELATGIGSGLLIAAMWASMGFLLGTALRGTALSIGLGLVWILAIESLVVNVAAPLLPVFAKVQEALPGVNSGSLVAALAGKDAVLRTPGVTAINGGGQAAAVLAGFLVAFDLLAAVLLIRRDVL